MISNNLFLGKEFILKEEEKYQLTRMGAIGNLWRTIDQALSSYAEKHVEKAHFLHFFYTQIIDYPSFVNKQKASNRYFRQNLSDFSHTYIKAQQRKHPSRLDKELRCKQVSIGWHFPSEVLMISTVVFVLAVNVLKRLFPSVSFSKS